MRIGSQQTRGAIHRTVDVLAVDSASATVFRQLYTGRRAEKISPRQRRRTPILLKCTRHPATWALAPQDSWTVRPAPGRWFGRIATWFLVLASIDLILCPCHSLRYSTLVAGWWLHRKESSSEIPSPLSRKSSVAESAASVLAYVHVSRFRAPPQVIRRSRPPGMLRTKDCERTEWR